MDILCKSVKAILTGTILCLQFLLSFSQEPYYKKYEIDDGIADQEVYSIFLDSKGYLWFGTGNGLNRFDGKNFELFNNETGMAMNTTYRMFEDSKGRLWSNASNHISWFENEQWHNFVDDTTWGDLKIKSLHREFYEHTNGDIFVGTYEEGLLVIRNNHTVEHFVYPHPSDNQISLVRPIPNGNLELYTTKGFFEIDPQTGEKLTEMDSTLVIPRISYFAYAKDGSIYFSRNNKLERLNGDIWEKCIPPSLQGNFETIITIYEAPSGDLWLGTINGAFRIKNKVFKPENITHFLKGQRISGIREDWEGNYWFTSLDAGIFFTPSLAVTYYDKESYWGYKNILCVGGGSDGNIWVGSNKGQYARLAPGKPDKFQLPLYPSETRQIRVKQIKADPNGTLWFLVDDYVAKLDKNGPIIYYSLGNVKDLNFDEEGNFYWATGYYAYQLDRNKMEDFRKKLSQGQVNWYENYRKENLASETVYLGRANSMLRDQKKRIWVGTGQDLYLKKGDSLVGMVDQLISGEHGGVMALEQSKSGAVIAMLYQIGVFIFYEDQCYRITPEMGIPASILDMKIDTEDNIWFTSNQGLVRMKIDENKELIVDHFGREDGLVTNAIFDVYVQDDIVWAACSKGLIKLDLNTFSRATNPPPIFIQAVYESSSDTAITHSPVLRYNQNNIKINYKTISYRGRDNLRFKYRLLGLSEDWNFTKNQDVQFFSLPPGDYTFQVLAQNVGGIWSSSPATFSFYIQPAIWQRTWFWVIIFILATGFIWGLLFNRFRVLREKTKITRKMVESEQKALRAQMTPHFIFNSLNSIQQLISQENRVQALRFTSKFSRLMRRIMENSRQRFISVSEELETLQLYLELEALRFDQKFTFKFDIGADIDPEETDIPPMIIQPFVENSIWHGLLHKKENDGLIVIKIHKEGHFLVCHIEDNGIGRKASRELKSKHDQKHVSVGMTLTEERLELLNTMDNNKLSVNVFDLKNDEGKALGTRIELQILIDSD